MFNKIKSLSQILVSCYVIRLLITGASIGDALVICSLSTIYGLNLWLESKKEPEVNKEIKDKLIELENKTKQAISTMSAMKLVR